MDCVLRSLNSLLRLNLNSFCWYKSTNYFRIYQTISENFLKDFYFISEALLDLLTLQRYNIFLNKQVKSKLYF